MADPQTFHEEWDPICELIAAVTGATSMAIGSRASSLALGTGNSPTWN
jgi:hypothetical protein